MDEVVQSVLSVMVLVLIFGAGVAIGKSYYECEPSQIITASVSRESNVAMSSYPERPNPDEQNYVYPVGHVQWYACGGMVMCQRPGTMDGAIDGD